MTSWSTGPLFRMAGKLIGWWAGEEPGEYFGEATGELAGQILDRALGSLRGDDAERLGERTFALADRLFAEACRERGLTRLADAVTLAPFGRTERLERLALALPDTVDRRSLTTAVREGLAAEWPGLADAETLDRAATLYVDCLHRALAATTDDIAGLRTLLEAIRRMIEEIHDTVMQPPSTVRRRPALLTPDTRLVGREDDLARLVESIEAPTGGPVVLHGPSGLGKTLLAQYVALEIERRSTEPASGQAVQFDGGVLFQPVGRDGPPGGETAVLRAWADAALGGETEPADFTLDAANVRRLLARAGRWLVVLDDLWAWRTAQPLLDAVPPGTRLLVTTQKSGLGSRRGSRKHPLGLLPKDQAAQVLRERVPRARPEHEPLLERLVTTLERHTLALTIAGGSLEHQAYERWPGTVARIECEMRAGLAFGDLGQDGDAEERDPAVEASLSVAYADLDDAGKARFRALGAFAPSATFHTGLAVIAWESEDADDALRSLDDLAGLGLVTSIEGDGNTRWQQHAVMRWYALALLRRAGELDAAASHHADACVALLRAVERQEHHALLEYGQIGHAFAWAVEHDQALAQEIAGRTFDLHDRFGLGRDALDWADRLLAAARAGSDGMAVAAALGTRGNALQRVATLGDEDRGARLREALAAYDEALVHYTPQAAPLDYAMTQNNRGAVLSDLATLGDEDRGTRLREALAAYDAALVYRTPQAAPLDYATTQNNRGTVLQNLATLGDEDRGARLRDALAAFDAALVHSTPQAAPLDYAMTQNNRGIVLSNLATLGDEDRGARLRAALAAYDASLIHYTPQAAPLDYAMTQNNRGTVLADLATLGDEDRGARLREALAAFDAALVYRTPQAAPLDYAATQNNRGTVLRNLATLGDEDRGARLREALAAFDEALVYRTPQAAPLDYAMTQNNRGTVLSDLATLGDEDRGARLREALAAFDAALVYRTPQAAPLDYAMTRGNQANLFMLIAETPGEDRTGALRAALGCTLEALSVFIAVQHGPYARQAARQVMRLRDAAGDDFPALWREVTGTDELPEWLTDAP